MSLRAGLREVAAILGLPVLLLFSLTHTCWAGPCRRTFGAGLIPGIGLIEAAMPVIVLAMMAYFFVSEVG